MFLVIVLSIKLSAIIHIITVSLVVAFLALVIFQKIFIIVFFFGILEANSLIFKKFRLDLILQMIFPYENKLKSNWSDNDSKKKIAYLTLDRKIRITAT